MIPKKFQLDSYRYDLEAANIAQFPLYPEEAARLLVVEKKNQDTESFIDGSFERFPELLPSGTMLFLNDTRVLRARIKGEFTIRRPSGTVQNKPIELLYLETVQEDAVPHTSGLAFECMVFPGDSFPIGATFFIGAYEILVEAITYRGRIFRFVDSSVTEKQLFSLLEECGEYPIPPYIESSSLAQDGYQTSFSQHPGSLAAPTASLHFSEKIRSRLQEKAVCIEYATLHVGIGTFKTVNEPDIRRHCIHPEHAFVRKDIFTRIASQSNSGGKIVAVGTTMIRFLESLPYVWNQLNQEEFDTETRSWWNARLDRAIAYENARGEFLAREFGQEHTSAEAEKYQFVQIIRDDSQMVHFASSLYIYDGFTAAVIHGFITNFHLPESTLLAMICALNGYENTMNAYEKAKEFGYRFYSFGDGMFCMM